VTLVTGRTAGGIGRHVASLVPELAARGAEVTVVGPRDTRGFGYESAGGRFEGADMAAGVAPLADLRGLFRLRRLMRGSDLVHAHGIKAGVLGGLAARWARVRAVVVTFHNPVLRRGGTARRAGGFGLRVAGRLADRRIFVSPHLTLTDESELVIPAGVSPQRPTADEAGRARTSLGLGTRRIVLSVGRLSHEKGPDLLVEAAGRLSARDVVVVLVGDGPMRPQLEAMAEERRLGDRLVLAGHRDDARALIESCDLFCLPSRKEGSPLALQEAMLAAVPIVATDIPPVRRLTGEDGALLVPPEDPDSLAVAIDKVLSDPALAARLAREARRAADRLPDSESVARRIADLYEQLLGRALGGDE
jgi:glycosyltransferase involved in cell wall biosynthesis